MHYICELSITISAHLWLPLQTKEGFDAWLDKQCATTKNKTIAVRVKKLEAK